MLTQQVSRLMYRWIILKLMQFKEVITKHLEQKKRKPLGPKLHINTFIFHEPPAHSRRLMLSFIANKTDGLSGIFPGLDT